MTVPYAPFATTERATSGPRDPRLTIVQTMSQALDSANGLYDAMDRYYSGDQPAAFMSPEVRAQIGNTIARMVINWPEVVVDSVTRRLTIEGFRLGLGGNADDELWRIFMANELAEESPLSFADAMVHGISYLSVWGNDEDPSTPVIAVESAHQVTVQYAPDGKTVNAALKRWLDGDTAYATLYLPEVVLKYAARVSSLPTPTMPAFELIDSLPNVLGVVPIVPIVNKGRTGNRFGRSELKSIAPLADGVNKIISDMMVTSEFYVTPRRYVTGMAIPSGVDRERFQAEMKQFWEDAPKSKFLVAGDGASFGQFPEADLAGFVSAANLLTSALAAIGGLPPDDLGLNTTNPASAEARRAAETTLVNRVKEKWAPYGGAYTRAMRLAIAARDRVPVSQISQDYSRMQVAWADPATPAIAQAMDAAVKGVDAGIFDIEAGQASVSMPPVERAAMKARAAESAAQRATADVKAQLDLADTLMRERGLSQQAAFATVGLLQAASAIGSTPTPPSQETP